MFFALIQSLCLRPRVVCYVVCQGSVMGYRMFNQLHCVVFHMKIALSTETHSHCLQSDAEAGAFVGLYAELILDFWGPYAKLGWGVEWL